MKIININKPMPIFKHEVENHQSIKLLILKDIEDAGTYSLVDSQQRISNTDWHLSSSFNRPYYKHVEPIIENVCADIHNYFGYTSGNMGLTNYWFQQYAQGDYHLWHSHGKSSFSCVYYVSLQGDNPKTSFRLNDEEFEIEVKEGEVLTFPSFIEHTSKENKSGFVKTVVAFNLTTSV